MRHPNRTTTDTHSADSRRDSRTLTHDAPSCHLAAPRFDELPFGHGQPTHLPPAHHSERTGRGTPAGRKEGEGMTTMDTLCTPWLDHRDSAIMTEVIKWAKENNYQYHKGYNWIDVDVDGIDFHAHATGEGYLIAHDPLYRTVEQVKSIDDVEELLKPLV